MRKFFRWHTSLSYRQQVSCSILAAIILATLLLYCLGISSFLMRERLIETHSTPIPLGSPVPASTALPRPPEATQPGPTATGVITPSTPLATESP